VLNLISLCHSIHCDVIHKAMSYQPKATTFFLLSSVRLLIYWYMSSLMAHDAVTGLCVVSCFLRRVNDIWALFGFYAVQNGIFLPTLQDNLSVLSSRVVDNPLNAELNPICHLLALLGAHHFLHVSRVRFNMGCWI